MNLVDAAFGGALVQVVDHLVTLLKTRKESRQGLIYNIAAPFFESLESAYRDYITTLRKAHSMVNAGEDYSTIYSDIEALRASDLITRNKVRAMAATFKEQFASHSDLSDFFEHASDLFGFWNDRHNSATRWILTALKAGIDAYDRRRLESDLQAAIYFSEDNWTSIAAEYAGIRANYLKP